MLSEYIILLIHYITAYDSTKKSGKVYAGLIWMLKQEQNLKQNSTTINGFKKLQITYRCDFLLGSGYIKSNMYESCKND